MQSGFVRLLLSAPKLLKRRPAPLARTLLACGMIFATPFFGSVAALLAGSPALAESGALVKSYDVENAAYKACVEAGKLMQTSSWAAARDILLKAAASDPTSYSANVHLQLADCYKALKDSARAASEAELALKYDPRSQEAMYVLAIASNELGQYDKATKQLNELLKVTKDSAFAEQIKNTIKGIVIYKNVRQADKCMKSDRIADARTYLEAAAALDPSSFSSSIHGNLSFVLERTGHPEAAIVEGKKALKFDPSEKATVYSIGISYQDIGKFDDAIYWLRQYVSLETDAAAREKASEFIQELSDDKVKLDPAANSKPDYLEQLKANDAVNMWPQEKFPLKVYISTGKGVSGYRPIFKPFIIRSLNTWYEVSGKKLSYKIVDDKSAADIRVRWTRDPLPMEESGRVRQKAGLTHVNLDNDKKIEDATVTIRTVNGFDQSKLITDGEAASVSMHEIGHALGLGHSTCCSDIMYFGSSSKQTGFPSTRDKATMARLYQPYSTVAFTEQAVAIPAGTHIDYLPPPAFLPPVPTNTDKLPPPVFVPPPAVSASDKLQPPVFVPPPLNRQDRSSESPSSTPSNAASKKNVTLPVFMPPPLAKKKTEKEIAPPLFVPLPK